MAGLGNVTNSASYCATVFGALPCTAWPTRPAWICFSCAPMSFTAPDNVDSNAVTVAGRLAAPTFTATTASKLDCVATSRALRPASVCRSLAASALPGIDAARFVTASTATFAVRSWCSSVGSSVAGTPTPIGTPDRLTCDSVHT